MITAKRSKDSSLVWKETVSVMQPINTVFFLCERIPSSADLHRSVFTRGLWHLRECREVPCWQLMDLLASPLVGLGRVGAGHGWEASSAVFVWGSCLLSKLVQKVCCGLVL